MTGPASRRTVGELSADPHPTWHRLRSEQPVAWVDSLEAWVVTSHELGVEVMLHPDTYTVDDPRFSTQRVIGPSMLSLDGSEHRRHRDPFAGAFRAARVGELALHAETAAAGLIAEVVSNGSGDLRADVAGPLAVKVMARVLDLDDVDVGEVLSWYRDIVEGVHIVTAGGEVPDSAHRAFDDLGKAVAANPSSSDLLGPVADSGSLTVDEMVSNVAVLLFGGIVTSEAGVAIAFRALLADAELMNRIRGDPSLIAPFVEETFRLEPSAAAIDRYATTDVRLGDVDIARGDLVRVSLSGANRDPAVFDDPDRLDIERTNLARSLTFARGPHACLGIHLARLETRAAVAALLHQPAEFQGVDLDDVTGLVFRAPATVRVRIV